MDATVDRSRRRRIARFTLIGVVLAFEASVLYVLCYAPFLRVRYGADAAARDFDGGAFVSYHFDEDHFVGGHAAFAPVEWMIDNGALVQPLNWWARNWGVDAQQEWRAHLRRLESLDFPKTWSDPNWSARAQARKQLRAHD
ncbi:MAG TPA: hypothetical protein VML55_06965 [Planctomycetaceae bacterium]|nr:hypothetical protein [Planctomycetaceae bacterium]